MGKRDVRPSDQHHGLARRHTIAVVERVNLEILPGIAGCEAGLQDRDRLVGAAKPGVLLLEHLHRDLRHAASGREHVASTHEVLVGVVPFAHPLDGKLKSLRWDAAGRTDRRRRSGHALRCRVCAFTTSR